jgi:hypothetical protein
MLRQIGHCCVVLGAAFVVAATLLVVYLFMQSPLFN